MSYKRLYLGLAAIILAGVLYFFINGNDESPEEPVDEVETEEKVVEVKELPKVKVKEPEVDPEEGLPDKLLGAYGKYLREDLPLAQSRDRKCNQNAEGIFVDPNYIDFNDKFYKKPTMVLDRLHDVYSKTLVRPEVIDAYNSLGYFVENDLFKLESVKTKKFRNQMQLLEYYCRPESSLRFIETVMEASKHYKYPENVKKEIFQLSMYMLETVIGNMFTTGNLIYSLGFFRLMVGNKILPPDVLDDVTPMFEEVMTHHRSVIEDLKVRDGDEERTWEILKEDQKIRSEFGSEVKNLVEKMKKEYYPE